MMIHPVADHKVQAAMGYLGHLELAQSPRFSPFGGEALPPRKLTQMECQVRDAALFCLLEFFRSDSLGNCTPVTPPDEPGEDGSPVLIPVITP